eukprot:TRINITY_DN5633_c0_g1_i1.p1 TRINITY_DN5633_c0_g1~~TRINITY_DN5633_c0_g1_i1.p1  ORF type:complete len:418 (+),score=141.90 TRINITY_DN5633_c0_g1_i1:58-1311(+)
MWNAIKGAVDRIGHEVTDVLDTLANDGPEATPLEATEGEEEEARLKGEGVEEKERVKIAILEWKDRFVIVNGKQPDQSDFEASELFAKYKLGNTRVQHKRYHIDGLNVDLPSVAEVSEAADRAADQVARWFSAASSEVSRAAQSSVNALNEFVEAKKSEASSGDDSKLLQIVLRIDTLEARTQNIHAKIDEALELLDPEHPIARESQEKVGEVKMNVHVTWDELEEEFYDCLSTLNKLIVNGDDDNIKQLAKKQITRVEALLEAGDAALVNLSKVSKNVRSSDDVPPKNESPLRTHSASMECVEEEVCLTGAPSLDVLDESQNTGVGVEEAKAADEEADERAECVESATPPRKLEDKEVEGITAAGAQDADADCDSSPYTTTPICKSDGPDTTASFEEVRPPSKQENPFEWDEELDD